MKIRLLTDESSDVPNNQTTRKVSYLTDSDQPHYWVPAAPLKNFRNSKGHLHVKRGFTELYEHRPVKNQPKETSLTKSIIFEIKNLRKHIDADDKLWYYLSSRNSKGVTEQGWIKEDDAKLKTISAYDWAEFGFQIIDDSANDHIYDCKNPSKFLSQICSEIDSDKNGVLSQFELQQALKKYFTSYKLSRLVVKHVSEWAFDGSAIRRLKNQLDRNFTIEINKEKDPVKKQKYTDLKNVRLDAMQARLKNLCFWQEIKTSNNSFSLKELGGYILNNPLAIGAALASYVAYQFGKWIPSSKPDETEKPKIDLAPFPTDSPTVFHFHPTAFVEQMRKLEDFWHDPVDNPQLNKYTFSGNNNPANASFGMVRSGKLHSGVDLFALPGTPVYACMDGVVVAPDDMTYESDSAGKTIRIKIDSTDDFIKRINKLNYKLKFEEKGERMGCNIKPTDEVYLIYMHLSEYKVKELDIVKKGDVIGYNGMTGNANGSRAPHLHFEIATIKDAYGKGITPRFNPARVIELLSYDTEEQAESKNYKYYKDGRKEKC